MSRINPDLIRFSQEPVVPRNNPGQLASLSEVQSSLGEHVHQIMQRAINNAA